ncbi:MAG: YggS family pyridoxal phosphate-dependent enzyme [Synechococcales cyanobacterium]
MPAAELADRLRAIRAGIPDSVQIMAVTKGVTVEQMRRAYNLGLRHVGESRIQEAQAKKQALADLPDLVWHLIGHLQTNKIRPALDLFDWIDSGDSLKLAIQLDAKAAALGRTIPVCLQVKLAPDPAKFGWDPESLLAALPTLQALSALSIQGLMVILPLGLTPTEITTTFAHAVPLLTELRQKTGWEWPVLSMGMSDDYPQAIAAGSTLVRLGRSLFGERDTTPESTVV